MTYYLLEATLNGCIREFYFFSLRLMAWHFYYITIDRTVKGTLMQT